MFIKLCANVLAAGFFFNAKIVDVKGFVFVGSRSFLVLVDDSNAVQDYFSSEVWEELPRENKVFILDHDIQKVHKKEGSVLYISSYALMPQLRGKGLGKPFFKRCLDIVLKSYPNIKSIVLIVSQEWESARHIYETLGFKTIRQIPCFFASDIIPGGADGIVMQK